MSLQWEKPRLELLNDDTGIYLYSITWQSLSLPHAVRVQYYYPHLSSSEDGIYDGYTVEDLWPSQEYEVCVSVATISKEAKKLLVGQAECIKNATLFNVSSEDRCGTASPETYSNGE